MLITYKINFSKNATLVKMYTNYYREKYVEGILINNQHAINKF